MATGPPATATPSATTALPPKGHSCLICRRRKVRCDRESPCGNCRRAGIACVVPATDRPPRWARRLERLVNAPASSPSSWAAAGVSSPATADGPAVDKVMERLRGLESLVKELSGQLEQARATVAAVNRVSPDAQGSNGTSAVRGVEYQEAASLDSDAGANSVVQPLGRLVLADNSGTRYVTQGFWSRINDELDGLKTDTLGLIPDASDSSEDGQSLEHASSLSESTRSYAGSHSFLFQNHPSPSDHDLRDLHPLPLQIPYLLEAFLENINAVAHVVHIPSLNKIVREWRMSGMTQISPSNEALLFAIWYAAINSLEDEDVISNFNTSRADLSMRYRLGLERALAKADFLNAPDIILITALLLFLLLARRHDSPRMVWMMSGLALRMAQFLGLHRDGTHFSHLSPFEVEMRRRLWWALCALDVRTAEDQGTDLSIHAGSFDTRIPANINDSDISPESPHAPVDRNSVTEMSFSRIQVGITTISRQITAIAGQSGANRLEEQNRLVSDLYHRFEDEYLQHAVAAESNATYRVAVTIARIVMSKLTLIIFLPALSTTQPNQEPTPPISDEIRTKLLVAAVEVAEYNHAINSDRSLASKQWRWVYQTHTHWHAIVYLMIETSQRRWSPFIERAWLALHSRWLIPPRGPVEKNLRIWVPLNKLMAKARKHRDEEIVRLRGDSEAARRLEEEDRGLPELSSPPILKDASQNDLSKARWRELVGLTPEGAVARLVSEDSGDDVGAGLKDREERTSGSDGARSEGGLGSMNFREQNGQGTVPPLAETKPNLATLDASTSNSGPSIPHIDVAQPSGLATNDPTFFRPQTANHDMGPQFLSSLWFEPAIVPNSSEPFLSVPSDADMDLDGDVNWYDLVQSANGVGWEPFPDINGTKT